MSELEIIEGKVTSLSLGLYAKKNHSDLLKAIRAMESAWVKKGKRNFSLTSYKDVQGKERAMYVLSKSECLYIASKFNDDLRASIILRWEELETEKQKPLTNSEMMLLQARINVENERKLINHDDRIARLEAAKTTRPMYFTVAGYATLNKVSVNLKQASVLGRKASKQCKQKGLQTDECPDPRWGVVKMYPQEVLKIVFDEFKVA